MVVLDTKFGGIVQQKVTAVNINGDNNNYIYLTGWILGLDVLIFVRGSE